MCSIFYATYYGSTEYCAKTIHEALKDSKLINITDENITLDENETKIIIGTPLHAWKIHRKLKKFIENNLNYFKDKKIYFYYCGIDPDFMEKAKSQFPEEFAKNIVYSEYFGGKLDKSKLTGIEKMGIEMIEKQSSVDYTDFDNIDKNKINRFIDKVLNKSE